MKQLTDEEALEIGKTVIKAAVAPNGAHSLSRDDYIRAGSAAEEATREMHNEARDAEWEQAMRSYARKTGSDDAAEGWIRNVRALLVSHSQSLEEQIEAVLGRVLSWSNMADATQQEVAAEIAALVNERTPPRLPRCRRYQYKAMQVQGTVKRLDSIDKSPQPAHSLVSDATAEDDRPVAPAGKDFLRDKLDEYESRQDAAPQAAVHEKKAPQDVVKEAIQTYSMELNRFGNRRLAMTAALRTFATRLQERVEYLAPSVHHGGVASKALTTAIEELLGGAR